MNKRIMSFLISCFLLLMPLVAYADLIIEPEDDFYKKHQDQIHSLDRGFAANGKGGSVSVKKEPDSKGKVANIKNGKSTYIQHSCLYDGDYWGYTSEYSGWVKLDQMLVLYDYISFRKDYSDAFYTYSGDYAEIRETRSAVLWPWPGADAPLSTVEDIDAEHLNVSNAYKDVDGREWGYIVYLYGIRSVWICLSDPLNDNIAAFNPDPEPSVWAPEINHIDIPKDKDMLKNEFSILIVIIILVTALAVGTAVLIRVVWKPNKAKSVGSDD